MNFQIPATTLHPYYRVFVAKSDSRKQVVFQGYSYQANEKTATLAKQSAKRLAKKFFGQDVAFERVLAKDIESASPRPFVLYDGGDFKVYIQYLKR